MRLQGKLISGNLANKWGMLELFCFKFGSILGTILYLICWPSWAIDLIQILFLNYKLAGRSGGQNLCCTLP